MQHRRVLCRFSVLQREKGLRERTSEETRETGDGTRVKQSRRSKYSKKQQNHIWKDSEKRF